MIGLSVGVGARAWWKVPVACFGFIASFWKKIFFSFDLTGFGLLLISVWFIIFREIGLFWV